MTTATKTDAEVIKTHDDVEMIKRPHLWAWKTVLPLEHRIKRDERGQFLCAYVIAGMPNRIFLGNIFARKVDDASIDYASPEQIVADGWSVD